MIIVFSGLDGSGKTTCAEALAGFLKGSGFFVKNMHIIKDSLHYRILHNLIGKMSESSKNSLEKSIRNKKGGIYFIISGFIKKFLLLLNLISFNLRYGWYRNNKSRILITDRYFYDEMIQAEYLGIVGRSFISIFKSLTIVPDVIFFLKVSPEIAYKRKSEYDKDYFEKKGLLYAETYKTVPNEEIPDMPIPGMMSMIQGRVKSMVGGS